LRRLYKACFDCHRTGVEGVVPEPILDGDEVGVAVKQRVRLICVVGCRLFRPRGGKLPHLTGFLVFNCFSDGPFFFGLVPDFVSAQTRFRASAGGSSTRRIPIQAG
jgi:hypothetical protein